MKIGNLIKHIPESVIVGFTAGIGVIIFTGQWKDFFGLSVQMPLDAPFHLKFVSLIQALPHFNLATTGLALVTLLILLVSPKIIKTIPGPLIAMFIATTLQAIFQFSHVATIGSTFGGIPSTLPEFHLPTVSLLNLPNLLYPALTIALLGAIESLLSATAADKMAKTQHHANQELIGQGLANIVAPLFGGFAATGAIARTATNVRNGGNSPIAAIIHSVLLVLIILVLAPLAKNIPLCALAAILFVVSYNMSDVPHFIHISRHEKYSEKLVLYTTFLLTIFVNLVVAVMVGTILAKATNQFKEPALEKD